MKIGVFGGAFNPVHNGHLHLIDTLCAAPLEPDFTGVDKMLIIPTADPPHRTGNEFAAGEDRLNMLRLAVTNPKAEISDIEFHLEGKSYTYNTLKALKAQYPDDRFYLFMGSDQLLKFKEWYRYQDIAAMAQVVGFSREQDDLDAIKQFVLDNSELRAAVVVAQPYVMSSTAIRSRVRNGESIREVVPSAVDDYIKEHGLYG